MIALKYFRFFDPLRFEFTISLYLPKRVISEGLGLNSVDFQGA